MVPEALKDLLTTVTNHEEEYRSGIVPDTSQFQWIQFHGQKVMKFSYARISAENDGIPFQVRKHSRFRDYPFHIHDWIEISYMYSGCCDQIIENKEFHMETGQLLLMAPNTVHTIKPLSQNDVLVQIALGQKHLTNQFFNHLSSSGIISSFFINAFAEADAQNSFFLFPSEDDRRLRLFIEEFLCEWFDPSASFLDILNNLFFLIIAELVNIMDEQMKSSYIRNKNTYIIPLLRYIEKNYRTCTLSETSKEFGLNPNYLSNMLKKNTGSSFNQLVMQEKMAAAERLLNNTDMSVTEIVRYVGYNNISFFYKKFSEKYGCLPGEYRNQTVRS